MRPLVVPTRATNVLFGYKLAQAVRDTHFRFMIMKVDCVNGD